MKTATTWLQKVYLPTVTNIHYMGRDHVNDFFLKDDVFDFNPAKLRDYYSRYLEDGKRLVFSSERIIGPVSLGYREGAHIKCNADRIASVFPDAEIVIFIRSQENLMSSCYVQYVRNGGNFPVGKFLEKNDNSLFKYLEFHKIIGYYKSVFKKVHVFAYEDFASNPKDFIERFEKTFNFQSNLDPFLFEKRQNPSIHPFLLPIFKFVNLFVDGNGAAKYQLFSFSRLRVFKNQVYQIVSKSRWLTTPSRPEAILGTKRIDFIRSYYVESNRKLVSQFGLDVIKQYNYPL